MISSSEKQRLLEAYSAPLNARAAVARAAAGLVIVFGMTLIGANYSGDAEPRAAFSTKQGVSGR